MSISQGAIGDDLRATCDDVRALAETLAATAVAATQVATRDALRVAVERHLGAAERALSSLGKRALLHDHRRLTQLMRAVELALDTADTRAVAAPARRLAQFVVEHDARERTYR